MRLQPVHVDDVAAAVEQALTRPEAAGRVFELGGGDVYTYRQVLAAVLDHVGRRQRLLPVPLPVWRLLAAIASILPQPPLTKDQFILMQSDNVVGNDVATFADLGITPRSLISALREAPSHSI